jgi:hypothetical protein
MIYLNPGPFYHFFGFRLGHSFGGISAWIRQRFRALILFRQIINRPGMPSSFLFYFYPTRPNCQLICVESLLFAKAIGKMSGNFTPLGAG